MFHNQNWRFVKSEVGMDGRRWEGLYSTEDMEKALSRVSLVAFKETKVSILSTPASFLFASIA